MVVAEELLLTEEQVTVATDWSRDGKTLLYSRGPASSRSRSAIENSSPECHVPEADFSGLMELHIYNIRHLQHHTGQLMDRLRTAGNIGVAWVGSA